MTARLLAFLLLVSLPAAAFDLQGHRGARGLAPENTLPAFARALSLGVDTLELDVGVTRDGVVVVSHDAALNGDIARGPDGKWLGVTGPTIHSLTYAQLRRYDVGRLRPESAYARRYPDQVPVDGARIPRLADVFALAARAGNSRVRFNIETKISPLQPHDTLPPEAFTRAVIREVRRARLASRVTIQSFDWRTLAVVQREAPEIGTVYLTSQQVNPMEGSAPQRVAAAGGKTWSPDARDLDAAKLAEARALGLRVIPWTVNDPRLAGMLIDAGVDGLITDRPDLVRYEMGNRGMILPAATPVKN